MPKRVHIKIADRGWILEKCAREIADRASNVTYGTDAAGAELQYYINYSARRGRVSAVEVAFFTHSENDPEARKRYFDCANEVDHCVCMSAKYAQELIDSGISADKVTTIAPGVDLDEFRPKIRVGVVGRTYHTGRKGEALVADVMDLPGIEWRFTGSGWPGPSTHVADGAMSDFYNDLDYVLVPAFYEGGPMSVLEGLACGVPIISSDVGWVSEYPHIPFENGNAESLRNVLTGLVTEREALRAPVLDRTWKHWADAHVQLFDRLLGGGLLAEDSSVPADGPTATLLTHGSEGKTQGGPSVRVPKTAAALRDFGINAQTANFPGEHALDGDLVHLFNIWPPRSSIEAARAVVAAGKRLVVSPILLDLTEIDFWQRRVLAAIADGVSPALIEQLQFEYFDKERWERRNNPEPAFSSRVRELAGLADALIFLSEREQSLFEGIAGQHPLARRIHNPVDANRFGKADPALFREFIGLDDFILCVGRIEPRKNQLFLAAAARELGLPLVLIGHAGGDGSYAQAVSTLGGDMLRSVGRVDPQSDMLASAFAACRVFALPSWAEGAPLAALEAAASGANLVLSNRSGEQEYFEDLARYVDPGSVDSMKSALTEAWNDATRADRSQAVQERIRDSNSWERYAQNTADLYRDVLALEPRAKPASEPAHAASSSADTPIFVEVSTTVNAQSITGINRVEAFVTRELMSKAPSRVRFVVWNDLINLFLEVPHDVVAEGKVADYVKSGNAAVIQPSKQGGDLLVIGSGWFQNSRYAEAMGTLAHTYHLKLNVLIHDIIPALRPHWFAVNYAPVFISNLGAMLRRADRVMTYSENTAADVRAFAGTHGINCPPLSRICLAEEIEGEPEADADDAIEDRFSETPLARSRFILSVGAIHKRKNYDLLYDCWVELRDRLGGSCPHLVIVGGVGWDGAETARALKEDPRLEGLVHILEGVSDAELAWLYRHCLFTLYPSLYEGWGLPVAESLAAGKLVLASNVSSVPEVAPGLCELIDPIDRSAWVTKIIYYSNSSAARARREEQIAANFKPTTWAQTAESIVQAVAQPVAPKADQDLYSLGEPILFSNRNGLAHKTHGWHLSEKFGSWASEKHAGLHFVLRPEPSRDLVLNARTRIFGRPGTVRVYANGEWVADWTVPSTADVFRSAVIPRALIRSNGCLDIDFESPRIIAVRSLNEKSGDRRSLGFGLAALQIAEQGSDDSWDGVAPLRPLPKDEIVSLSAEHPGLRLEGFHPVEPDGRWSAFTHGEMSLKLPADAPRMLRLDLWAPLARSGNARVIVTTGNRVQEFRLTGAPNEMVWVPLEDAHNQVCQVQFVVDSMFVPALHRMSEDKRKLGILVRSLALLTATPDEVPSGVVSSPQHRSGLRRRLRRLMRTLRGR